MRSRQNLRERDFLDHFGLRESGGGPVAIGRGRGEAYTQQGQGRDRRARPHMVTVTTRPAALCLWAPRLGGGRRGAPAARSRPQRFPPLLDLKQVRGGYREGPLGLTSVRLPRPRRLTGTIVALAGARVKFKFRSKNSNAFSHGDKKMSTSEAPPEAGRRTPATQLQLSNCGPAAVLSEREL